jgi:hypothetical protein
VRLFGTLIMAIDRARDAYVLWQRGLGLFLRAPWAFEPGFVELAETLRRFGVSRRHRVDSKVWRTIPKWPRLSIRPSSTAKGTPSPGWMKGARPDPAGDPCSHCCASLRSDRYGFGSRPIPGTLPSDASTNCGCAEGDGVLGRDGHPGQALGARPDLDSAGLGQPRGCRRCRGT